MNSFRILIYPGYDGYYVAECPILRGCVSQGKTIDEARTNIKEAIELWLEVAKESGDPIPFEETITIGTEV